MMQGSSTHLNPYPKRYRNLSSRFLRLMVVDGCDRKTVEHTHTQRERERERERHTDDETAVTIGRILWFLPTSLAEKVGLMRSVVSVGLSVSIPSSEPTEFYLDFLQV